MNNIVNNNGVYCGCEKQENILIPTRIRNRLV